MTVCNWPVSDVRRCRRGGSPFLSELVLCWQHQRVFLDALRYAIRRPEDRYEEAIQATAQEALTESVQAASKKRDAELRAASLVYFVERDGFVKIGRTQNLKRRIQQINTGSCLIDGMTVGPVDLLATIDGSGEETERWLHRRFAHLRIGGEWFLPDNELRMFIAGLKGAHCAPQPGQEAA